MSISYFRSDADDDRVDGRELVGLDESGSDDRLLRGLLERIREGVLGEQGDDVDSEPRA